MITNTKMVNLELKYARSNMKTREETIGRIGDAINSKQALADYRSMLRCSGEVDRHLKNALENISDDSASDIRELQEISKEAHDIVRRARGTLGSWGIPESEIVTAENWVASNAV